MRLPQCALDSTYATCLQASNRLIQAVNRFQPAPVWSTILRSRELKAEA